MSIGVVFSTVEALQFSLQYTVSQVQWVNSLLHTTKGSNTRPEDAPTLKMEPVSLLALSFYIGDPDMIDHWPGLEAQHFSRLLRHTSKFWSRKD